MERIDRGGPVYYRFEQWPESGALAHGVFTRQGGVSRAPFASLNVGGTVGDDLAAVRENLRRIYAALSLDGERACTVWQVHSADTVLATERTPGRHWLARADGMITNRPGLPLTMRFADCVPLLFHDPVHRAVGIAHAGWRGTVGMVGVSVVRAMQAAFGTDPADLQVAIGPSIGPERYEVGSEVAAAVLKAFGEDGKGLLHYPNGGKAHLDLWAANRLALERVGVRQIEVAGLCTAAHVDDFFSHRAERGKTGRFCAVIALREDG